MWAFIWLEMKQKIDSLQLASYSFLLEWEEDELQAIHSLPASCLPFLRQETNGLQDYIFITGFLFVFWDLHLNIKASKRNFLGGPVVKNPPSNVGDVGSSLVRELRSHMLWSHSERHCMMQRRSHMPQLRPTSVKEINTYLSENSNRVNNQILGIFMAETEWD